jgi:hypothetical protein
LRLTSTFNGVKVYKAVGYLALKMKIPLLMSIADTYNEGKLQLLKLTAILTLRESKAPIN